MTPAAQAIADQFIKAIESTAGIPFDQTGVSMPKDEVWERYANAAIAEAYKAAAEVFETYASDQIGSKRWQSSAREKRDCDIRAGIWNDAAKELREAAGSA